MVNRHNIIPNPACKNNLTGWAGTATYARSTTLTGMNRSTGIAITGGSGFVQTPTSADPAGIPFAAGDVITVSFDIKNNTAADIASGRQVFIAYTRSAGGDVFPESFNTAALGVVGHVQRASFTCAAAPALATGIYLIIDQLNTAGIEVTAVLYEKVNAVDTYFDGDTTNGSWDGADGNSVSTLTPAVSGATPNGIPVPVALGPPTVSAAITATPSGLAVPVRLGIPRAGNAPVATDGGGWYGLVSILKERVETKRIRESVPPTACPHDGEPLVADGTGTLRCHFDGWQWPRDGGAIR